jgi:hypothetical protein
MSIAELARQRMTAPPKPQAEGDGVLGCFLLALTEVSLVSIALKMESEAVPIIVEYLGGAAKNAEVLLTRCALAYAETLHVTEAEALLRQVLVERPDYEPAQVLFAAVLSYQHKPGFLPIAEKTLAQSTEPSLRKAAMTIIELDRTIQKLGSA